MHYIDEGQGETILFVHGTPSWSFDYRNIINKLKPAYRCIAVDQIGFGLSDKPEHYDYSTQNHCKTLEEFILEKQRDNLTLVVQDFGLLSIKIAFVKSCNHMACLQSFL